jgi:hypothetical protein
MFCLYTLGVYGPRTQPRTSRPCHRDACPAGVSLASHLHLIGRAVAHSSSPLVNLFPETASLILARAWLSADRDRRTVSQGFYDAKEPACSAILAFRDACPDGEELRWTLTLWHMQFRGCALARAGGGAPVPSPMTARALEILSLSPNLVAVGRVKPRVPSRRRRGVPVPFSRLVLLSCFRPS